MFFKEKKGFPFPNTLKWSSTGEMTRSTIVFLLCEIVNSVLPWKACILLFLTKFQLKFLSIF